MPQMDPLYLLFSVPALLLSMLASFFVKSTFNKYSKVTSSSGLTGAQAADIMLKASGVTNVKIEHVNGFLSDHYDPSVNTLRLSDAVYGSNSLSALGVACHEAGHALQKANNYAPMGLRTLLVLPANLGSKFSYVLILGGAAMQQPFLIKAGIILFTAAVAFSVVTLPVEWDASARAKKALVTAGILQPAEREHAGSVLNAAFMTYVAGAVSSLATLLYYLIRAGVIGGGRRRD
ncbi:MAG: zinc metallopeptidase [Victivallales bacterium]|nr:zinc metallopeptidase [Victivallales bacterium]